MKLNPKQWETLDEALKSTSPLSEDTFRRSVAYVEESIYKPSVVEQIVLTWSEYFQVYLAEYKVPNYYFVFAHLLMYNKVGLVQTGHCG